MQDINYDHLWMIGLQVKPMPSLWRGMFTMLQFGGFDFFLLIKKRIVRYMKLEKYSQISFACWKKLRVVYSAELAEITVGCF